MTRTTTRWAIPITRHVWSATAGDRVDPFEGAPTLPGPLFTAGPGIVVTSHAAFAVGLAEGAVQDLINLTATGHRPALGHIDLRNSPTFQYELGRVDAHLRAARSLMWEQCDKDWQDAFAGRAEFNR